MVRFTQIFRTEKKEALEREVTKKSIDQMKDLDFGPAKREETEDEELRRVEYICIYMVHCFGESRWWHSSSKRVF